MPVQGNLATMPMTEILQWLGNAGKTGTLSIERNKVIKRILVREGRVIACASQEPADMLGHFLVSRGRISEATLRRALAAQEFQREHLGRILISMGDLSQDDLRQVLEEKAQETIFGLFEWDDAEFRYADGEISDPNIMPVNMRVDDILLHGAQRWDEMQRFRSVFNNPGIILRRTLTKPAEELLRDRMGKTIYESINAQRSIAEIHLHAHGSEYVVTKFLYEMLCDHLIEIVGVKAAWTPSSLLDDDPVDPEDLFLELLDPEPAEAPPAPPPVSAPAEPPAAAAPAARVPAPPLVDQGDLDVARRLLNRGDFDSALEILDRAYKAQPGDEALRRILAEAEASFIEKAYKHYLPPSKVVALAKEMESLKSERLSPTEFFLLSRIDGTWDVKSIIQITPLREVDVLRTLKRMREKGLIDLKDPVVSPA